MALESILLLILIFTVFVLILLFKNNIYWERLFARRNHKTLAKSTQHLDNFSRKFKGTGTRLYKVLLNVLDLEVCEAAHFKSIGDNFSSFADLSDAIRDAGLESSNIILGIDFTASNEFQGKNSFDHKSLHYIGKKKNNPYQQVISSLAAVLEPFDDDNLIPCYGFGDEATKDHDVFPFNKLDIPCKGFLDVLDKYEAVVKSVKMDGPTSFVPIIKKAIEITSKTMAYNILIIIADGQVEEDQDEETRNVIIEASSYPLSIIVVGVGDGPWDRMYIYDEKLPSRKFDNFQFVDYTACMHKSLKSPEVNFALNALMEVPEQYVAIKKLGLLQEGKTKFIRRRTLDESLRDIGTITTGHHKRSQSNLNNNMEFRLPGMQHRSSR